MISIEKFITWKSMHTATDIQIPVSHTLSSGKTIKKRENETQGRRMNCAHGRAVGQG